MRRLATTVRQEKKKKYMHYLDVFKKTYFWLTLILCEQTCTDDDARITEPSVNRKDERRKEGRKRLLTETEGENAVTCRVTLPFNVKFFTLYCMRHCLCITVIFHRMNQQLSTPPLTSPAVYF